MNPVLVFVQALANFAVFVILSFATANDGSRALRIVVRVMGVFTFVVVVMAGINLFAR